MDLFYFLVTSLEQYSDKLGFHKYFFEGELPSWLKDVAPFPAFYEGFLCSLGIGAAIALAFYFGMCNGESVKPATRTNWYIGLLLVALAAFFVSDIMFIGADGNPGSGFYGACQEYAKKFMENHTGNQQDIKACLDEFNKIKTALNEGNDVALMFNVSNALLSMLFYLLASIGVKNFTKHGSQIPF